MISKELLVVTDFDETKSLDEVDFSIIPIWIRVERLPMGLMNRSAACTIGDDIGEFVEVEADGGELAAGRSLQLKIRMDIRKPLRWGITMDLGGDKGDRWCPYPMNTYLISATCVGSLGMLIASVPRSWGRMSLRHTARNCVSYHFVNPLEGRGMVHRSNTECPPEGVGARDPGGVAALAVRAAGANHVLMAPHGGGIQRRRVE